MFFFFQAEDGIRDLVRSRGLGDVYKRQAGRCDVVDSFSGTQAAIAAHITRQLLTARRFMFCLLYTSDAADERSSVDLGGRRILKQKTTDVIVCHYRVSTQNL